MSEKRDMKTKLMINGLGHIFNDSYMFIIPLLLPLFREEFHINYVQSGLIFTAHIAIRSINRFPRLYRRGTFKTQAALVLYLPLLVIGRIFGLSFRLFLP